MERCVSWQNDLKNGEIKFSNSESTTKMLYDSPENLYFYEILKIPHFHENVVLGSHTDFFSGKLLHNNVFIGWN